MLIIFGVLASLVIFTFLLAIGVAMQTIIGVLASLVIFVALAAIVIWESAKVNFLWTFVPRNRAIPFDKGKGNPYKILGIEGNDIRTWLGLNYGIYWMGLPPVEVHKFFLVHSRMNTNIGSEADGKETDHSKWIVTDPEPVETEYLLKTVVHWTTAYGVEFKGGRKADVLFQYQATVAGEEVVKTAVYDREGKFFDYLNSLIESSFTSMDRVREMEYSPAKSTSKSAKSGAQSKDEYFISADKDGNSPLMVGDKMDDPNNPGSKIDDPSKPPGLLQSVNKTAAQLTGYKLDSISIVRFGASSSAEEKLARLQDVARIEMAAAKLRAKGEVADVTELIAVIKRKLPDADDNTIMEEVSKLGVAHRYANSKNLQAVGGGAVVGLQSNDNKSSGNRKRRRN